MDHIAEFLGIHYEPNIITTMGVLVSVAFLGSKIFQRFGLPQVVGYILVGTFLGTSFLNVVPLQLTDELTFISQIALGVIGFDMGSHLYLKEMRQIGRSIFFILIFEAFGTFLLVSSGIYLLTNSAYVAVIFGALSSATAPAATVDVLAEYKAKGPLTTSLLAVVGMDDALSLVLFSLAAAFCECFLIGDEMPTLLQLLELPIIEIGGSLLLGIGFGLVLDFIMRRMKNHHDAMAVIVGFIMWVAGLSEALRFSLILTTMVMGMTIINRSPGHGSHMRYTLEQAGPVIYVLFFALVGARFQISLLPQMGILGLAYISLRTIGKYFGAWVGGAVGGAQPKVRDNLGLGLLSQAGVAIGLAIATQSRFIGLGHEGEMIALLVSGVITASTFVVQLFGPLGVKFAITRAGEIGQAIGTVDDWASSD